MRRLKAGLNCIAQAFLGSLKEKRMNNKRLILMEVCDIKDIPSKFLDIYKAVAVFQDQLSSDGLFSVDDINKFLKMERYPLLNDFVEYGVKNNFIRDGEEPLAKFSIKFR